MKIETVKDTIIVKKLYQKEVSGIVIPESARKFQLYDGSIKYIVVAVGPDYPYDLKIGDEVIIRRHEGKSFFVDGVEYHKMKERWVEAKVC